MRPARHLSAIDANTAIAGHQAFTFLDDLRLDDADADAEMQIYMPHTIELTAGDFILCIVR